MEGSSSGEASCTSEGGWGGEIGSGCEGSRWIAFTGTSSTGSQAGTEIGTGIGIGASTGIGAGTETGTGTEACTETGVYGEK